MPSLSNVDIRLSTQPITPLLAHPFGMDSYTCMPSQILDPHPDITTILRLEVDRPCSCSCRLARRARSAWTARCRQCTPAPRLGPCLPVQPSVLCGPQRRRPCSSWSTAPGRPAACTRSKFAFLSHVHRPSAPPPGPLGVEKGQGRSGSTAPPRSLRSARSHRADVATPLTPDRCP